MLGRNLHDRLEAFARRERPRESRWRPLVDELLREPSAALVEGLLTRRRKASTGLGLAEEHYLPGEDEAIECLREALVERISAGQAAPGASSEAHGLVRAELTVESDLPRRYRKGIFAEPRTYPAWACFHGPSAAGAADVEAPWFTSIDGVTAPRLDVKLMNVPGAKLLDDEKHTQDLCSVGSPTSPTASVLDCAQRERWRRRQMPLFYFVDPCRQRLLELLMHTLYCEPARSPLERRYYGVGPLLLGQGQAMIYSLRPRAAKPDVPGHTPDDDVRDAMARRLADGEVLFDLSIQLQTDPHAMPIEDASVRWPERLSPWVTVGTLRIPAQQPGAAERHRLARRLRFTPWHSLPEHRPLGSQSRALRLLYEEQLAAERRRAAELGLEHVEHVEPVDGESCAASALDTSSRHAHEAGAASEPLTQTEERLTRSATRPAQRGARAGSNVAGGHGRG